ncbi:MAG: DnaD domain protein [Oscillospiraceae bacterium]|nr:DnaD domain protein [Oscillospiraceae bacterium]
MEDKKYRLSVEPNLALPTVDADRLLALGDGTAALVYLYALRNGGAVDLAGAASSLKRTKAEVENTITKLCETGLFRGGGGSGSLPLPADELPEYTAEDIVSRAAENGEFRAVVEETQRIMGHMLTGADLKILFGIYDYLRLPAEVILLLINHCVEETRERQGPGKFPSMRTIEKEAYVWYNREILTFELAEEHLLRIRARSGVISEIKRILQINGRNFSSTERKYVESWLDMGFGPDAIALAYDRTVVKTGGLTWKYMNSIISSWNSKNLRTAEDILKGDIQVKSFAPFHQNGDLQREGGKPRDDAELMRKLLNQSRKG